MNAKRQSENILFIGLDWADQEHVCCLKSSTAGKGVVETSGTIEIASGRRIVVHFDRRSHNPILREAELGKDCPRIPWLSNHRLEFVYT